MKWLCLFLGHAWMYEVDAGNNRIRKCARCGASQILRKREWFQIKLRWVAAH